jgi:hypothetical protein
MATFPTLHLNGTGKITLRDEYAAAYDAIDKAIDALATLSLTVGTIIRRGRRCLLPGPQRARCSP